MTAGGQVVGNGVVGGNPISSHSANIVPFFIGPPIFPSQTQTTLPFFFLQQTDFGNTPLAFADALNSAVVDGDTAGVQFLLQEAGWRLQDIAVGDAVFRDGIRRFAPLNISTLGLSWAVV